MASRPTILFRRCAAIAVIGAVLSPRAAGTALAKTAPSPVRVCGPARLFLGVVNGVVSALAVYVYVSIRGDYAARSLQCAPEETYRVDRSSFDVRPYQERCLEGGTVPQVLPRLRDLPRAAAFVGPMIASDARSADLL